MDWTSRTLPSLERPFRDLVLQLCLAPEDLLDLGFAAEHDEGCPFTAHVLQWDRLRSALDEDDGGATAGRIADLLDLRHLEPLRRVRSTRPGPLARDVARHAGRPRSDERPGLLWALATDPRPCAQRLARLLARHTYHELLCVEPCAAARRAAGGPRRPLPEAGSDRIDGDGSTPRERNERPGDAA